MSYEILLNKVINNPKIISKLDSFSLYQLILLIIKNNNVDFLEKNADIIINKITVNNDFFDILIQFLLNKYEVFKDRLSIYIVKTIFDKKTIIFLYNINKSNLDNNYLNKQQIYNNIFESLNSFDNEKISIILYNLNILEDFNKELKRRYPILEMLLSTYQKFDIDKMTNNSYRGSTILGCLIKNNNQYLVEDYIKELIQNKNIKNVECIGAGSTCLVYRLGKSVLKLSEFRNTRKIFVNHRILASQVRKLLKDGDKELFYVEVMKYLFDTNVTKEECEELKLDLYRQGMNWEDAKIENCGLLNNNDDNISTLPMDYSEIYANVDNPVDREQFMKRKRKVVVLDNDNITPLPKLFWK